MVFSSATFLYAFLPITLLLYYIAPKAWRNGVLLAASLVFYAFGEPVYVLLLLFSSLSDWLHSLFIEQHRGSKWAKIALISSIVINLGLLGFFKYADFFVGTLNGLFGLQIPLTGVALPIGISFYTFQTMSYTIDVYRGRVHAQKNLLTLATFVCLFPQLIAGPIVRYSDVEAELQERRTTWDDLGLGIRRFLIGLGKKMLLANILGELCESFSAAQEQTVLFAWLYAIAFCLQIYFDFSGYSDMAIGLGRLFGFHFPENFDYPYLSRSITEFWRRWHMTLGGWFRDYVYIPLGGNRCSRIKWLRNLAIVWLLTGLWHGAAWNFVLWGAMFGLLLMVEKLWLGKLLEKIPAFFRHIYVLLLVIVSFVIFNAASIPDAFVTLKQMFSGAALYNAESLLALKNYAVILMIGCIAATDLPKKLVSRIQNKKLMTFLEPAFLAALLILATSCIVDGSFNPFIYFRF
ncbi:MAG: MBOAT family protein [Oscillospiraceae bacterium]|nr:MBOAT family protein [Oscillospiraceae bacterium]